MITSNTVQPKPANVVRDLSPVPEHLKTQIKDLLHSRPIVVDNPSKRKH